MAEFDSVIPAGGSGTLRAVIKTSEQQSGVFSKSINVQTDAADARTLVLRLRATIDQPIVAKPRMFLIVTATEGEELRGGLLLHRADGVPLDIYSVSSGNPLFKPRVEKVEKTKEFDGREGLPGDIWLEVVGDATLAAGTTKGTLRLETNHPDVSKLSIPYTMRVRPLITLRPDVVRMWPTSSTETVGRVAVVGLNRNDGIAFSITDIEVSHPDLFTVSAISTKAGQQQQIMVVLAENLASDDLVGSVDGRITIRTDDPRKPVIDVPVIVARNRTQSRRPPRAFVRSQTAATTNPAAR